ncbi:phosphorylase [Anabaena cylindrica FACHB-243]|uniref:Purine or other phosphorylase family 1 n=1 Tax=Anabaena cylindrica (strain ATCC 27899 / PCC 7122) TaxID=272123 RepID=K9ZF76_ANACC|nr:MULTISPECIES: purine or other phosphorylase family 1 [Anabaena]AFZ57399.1 purine or other phosphorylase family 1 [Anabaena cylindrica PCC 7122]MBD2421081.1 phosphorylase [Anabaena cylindrica FACHB-243]MBY5284945.1 phosphorylase [Anabaena sp. CCAP 1446/1C]MBY5306349.1 phosphorylase [Anabaena sp. CCAP 1446/1C]MCM2405834.1 phosphorylase [Anabaena sp. CCAP 1446/1C]
MHLIHTILVPQGAEYQAVCRGLSRVKASQPQVIAIPMGVQPLRQFLALNCQHLNQRVLLMGLCGSLNQRHRVGDVVFYRDCVDQENIQKCDFTYSREIHRQIEGKVYFVKGLTSDRMISSAEEKRNLHQKFGVDVVDMEGLAVLEFFQPLGVSVAMLRVVSDDSLHDIPNLTSAIAADGSLQPLPLTWAFIRQPLAATRLISGSLQGLKVLEKVASRLLTQ